MCKARKRTNRVLPSSAISVTSSSESELVQTFNETESNIFVNIYDNDQGTTYMGWSLLSRSTSCGCILPIFMREVQKNRDILLEPGQDPTALSKAIAYALLHGNASRRRLAKANPGDADLPYTVPLRVSCTWTSTKLLERHIEGSTMTLCEFLTAAEWIAEPYDYALCSHGTQGFALIYTPQWTFLFDSHGFERPGQRQPSNGARFARFPRKLDVAAMEVLAPAFPEMMTGSGKFWIYFVQV